MGEKQFKIIELITFACRFHSDENRYNWEGCPILRHNEIHDYL